MAKNDQEEAFEKVLSANLARLIDQEKFAEAKNGALIAFSTAWVVAIANLLVRADGPGTHYQSVLPLSAALFVFAALVALVSFFPRWRLDLLYGREERTRRDRNLLYFEDIAGLPLDGISTLLRERYMPAENGSANAAYLDDLSNQTGCTATSFVASTGCSGEPRGPHSRRWAWSPIRLESPSRAISELYERAPPMALSDLKSDLDEEVSTILGAGVAVEVAATSSVPYATDPKITFPNLDAGRLGCKMIETCVLYINMRRSTELNLRLRPETVAKLDSAFVRTMTRYARHCGGHVRGIIGDRVMVLFDVEGAFANAVNCAVLMNSAAKYALNRQFKSEDVTFGIGIDLGRMLATKTGIRTRGEDQQNYRNLVWIGRPANIASKLTDLASKPAEWVTHTRLHVGYGDPRAINDTRACRWGNEPFADFVRQLEGGRYPDRLVRHRNLGYVSHFVQEVPRLAKPAAPSILMTERVWSGFRAARPADPIVVNGWMAEIPLHLPDLGGRIYGGDVVNSAFRRD